MEDRVEKILDSLSKSKFRSSFHLKEKDMQYIKEKGLTKIKIHAYDFVNKRLKNTKNVNILDFYAFFVFLSQKTE